MYEVDNYKQNSPLNVCYHVRYTGADLKPAGDSITMLPLNKITSQLIEKTIKETIMRPWNRSCIRKSNKMAFFKSSTP